MNNYVIIYKDRVIYGPATYNKGMFSYILASTEEIYNTELPIQLTDMLVVNNNLKILPIGEEYTPIFNNKIEQLAGPYYKIKENSVDMFYEIAPQNIDSVKWALKAKAAELRYDKEIKDISFNLNDTAIIIDGSRDTKNSFVNEYQFMTKSSSVVWKFPKSNNFVVCDKNDILQIIRLFNEQTQDAFKWEFDKCSEIDDCTSLTELDNIILD